MPLTSRFWSSPSNRPPVSLLAGGVLVAAAALLPVVYLVVVASQRGFAGAVDIVVAPSTRLLLVRSLGLAAAVTASSVAIGVGLAFLVVRCDLPGRGVWRVLGAMPLALPSYVTAFAYVGLFPAVGGLVGAWAVLTLLCYPFVLLPVMATLGGLDPALEETARSLGDTQAGALMRLTIRQVRPAVATGSLLAALYVVSDFGAVTLLGVHTFTSTIYQSYLVGIDPPRGAVLGCVLLAFTFAIVAVEARTRGSGRYHRVGAGSPRPAPPVLLGTWRWPALLAPATIVVLALGVPLAGVAQGLGDAARAGVDLAGLGRALKGSVIAATTGAVVTVVAAVPVALLAARYRDRLSGAIERSTYLAHALPGVVVALSVAFFAVRFVPTFYRRLPVLVFAYLVLFLPLAVSALYARALQVAPAFDEVARSLGQPPRRVFRTVTGPLLAPGAATGLALVFLACLKELPATLLIGPFGFESLATQAWTASELGTTGQAAIPSLVLVAVGTLATALLLDRAVSLP